MNILHLLSQNHLTGSEVYACHLIEKQLKNNHTLIQISNGFFHETSAEKITLSVECKSLHEFVTSVIQLRKILILRNVQVIHAHSRAASKLAYWARLGLKVAYVSTVHGRQHISFSKKNHNIYGDFLIPICENIKSQLTHEFKYDFHYIKTIENGIDMSRFWFQQKSTFTRPAKSFIKIGIIGRDTGPKKIRTELFVDNITSILKSMGSNFKIDIVGGKKENFKFKSYDHIEFHESRFINSDFYHQFDLICGSGRVCIESLLCGVPCIAFGESIYCGLVTPENYHECKLSNFGDIGQNFDMPIFNLKQADLDFKKLFAVHAQPTLDLQATIQLEYQMALKKLSEMASTDFNLDSISNKIEQLYEKIYIERVRRFKRKILMGKLDSSKDSR